MHRAAHLTRRAVTGRAPAFSSLSRPGPTQPNTRLDVDLDILLRNVDTALRGAPRGQRKTPQELEVVSSHPSEAEHADVDHDGEGDELPRKSPAAMFGSQQLGQVVLPLELQDAIQRLIAESNKSQLHSDAKRLFQKDTDDDENWESHYDGTYRTRLQGVKHAKRDGTAFASVALPAHYPAIFAVFDHVKRRLGPSWSVEQVIDWGAGTGSGLWASLYSFQSPSGVQNPMDNLRIADATVKSYIAIEKRNGLSEIGRRLLHGIQPEHLSINWQKGWSSEENMNPLHAGNSVALSAFLLTTLPDNLSRKNLVQEIWESGANTIVLIDHNSKQGFEAIAGAREFLLELGRKDLLHDGAPSHLAGSHVVAPCPHDGACPLYFPGFIKLVCGYSQRIQIPEFVRRTKHSNIGHDDTGYSYVVIQRGPRPRPTVLGLGRVGAVGKRALEKEALASSIGELQVHSENASDVNSHSGEAENTTLTTQSLPEAGNNAEDVDEAIRLEAYQWPRLVFPPLKRSGHIILDGCTAEGKIMRMTIPKSQGKQAFYDARKSSWGDIFPHPPKNKPQERHHVIKPGSINVAGSDIGKRQSVGKQEKTTYEGIAKSLREARKSKRVEKPLMDEDEV
ncbi:hypothetical protein AGABI2DRAFT_182202 [Agaricus bisporus var. bisporus H97]|uniref:hypothetical protein n=1 Tax=Agaricus bisporus var. bisporus (strain H97 / ATCC MYA-4626 / FGSC 10389) TaxID=936046 RepID=UPI00029F51B0|nr:hypothetical protein AGABI2DRAFT_182202 [Agaricus bisporus var. bisporus H97]EKV51238.1 hypothetical protein AGABI2DRAFT_182202 [Agaricus bisporus var. bisporus H97]